MRQTTNAGNALIPLAPDVNGLDPRHSWGNGVRPNAESGAGGHCKGSLGIPLVKRSFPYRHGAGCGDYQFR